MQRSPWDVWNDLLQIPEARWIVAVTMLIFVVLIGAYVVLFFRNLAIGGDDRVETAELLTDFRRMRDSGQIGDDEFLRVKEKLPGDSRLGRTGNDQGRSEQPKTFLTLAQAQQLKENQNKQDNRANQVPETTDEPNE